MDKAEGGAKGDAGAFAGDEAKKPPVHVVPEGAGWAVLREGAEGAASLHPTQAEAADAGRAVARREGAAFLLHAKDGRVRERRDYSGGTPRGLSRPVGGPGGRTAEAVGEGAGGTGDAGRRGGAPALASRRRERPAEEGGADVGAQERRAGGFAVVGDRYADYNVYDPARERIGRLDAVFLDEADEPEYVGVRVGFSGTRSVLIPWESVAGVDEGGGRVEVTASKATAENGPTFGDDSEITPGFEEKVRRHYGLGRAGTAGERGAYGVYYPGEGSAGTAGTSGPHRDYGRSYQEDELRVTRSEEELAAGTRERGAGAVNVRKRVRVDRERVEVPVKRQEVRVERVPLDEPIPGARIGEGEASVRVAEEEVVVEKRPVVKEEVRVRKDVVQDTEVVEGDVRREEVEVEDATEARRRRGR